METTKNSAITVACRKRDAAVKIVPKYDNLADYNVTLENPLLPNGVYGYRHLRRTTPQISVLPPLAAWLVEQFNGGCVAGTQTTLRGRYLVCYNGQTEADVLRDTWRRRVRVGDPQAGTAEQLEGTIHCYDLNSRAARIEWLFPIIEPNESDETYWMRVADEIRDAKITRIVYVDNSGDERIEKELEV